MWGARRSTPEVSSLWWLGGLSSQSSAIIKRPFHGSKHLERARVEHVTTRATERSRPIDSFARLGEIAAADGAFTDLVWLERPLVIAQREGLGAARAGVGRARHS